MVTPQRSDGTIRLRSIVRDVKSGRVRARFEADPPKAVEDFPDAEEVTQMLPAPARAQANAWTGLPLWVRILVVVTPSLGAIGALLQQLISAWR